MRHILLVAFMYVFLYSTPNDVALMLKNAKHSFDVQKTVNHKREQEFLHKVQEQEKLLSKVKQEVAQLKNESMQLNNTIDANEKLLSQAEEKLMLRAGNLGELYGLVKQSSGDIAGELALSSTTQDEERILFLKELSKAKKLPNTTQLSKFWYIMLEELSLQGFVGKKELNFINADGKTLKKEIQIAGVFSTVTSEGFAKYIPDSYMFATLSKQPSSSYLSTALDGFDSNEAVYETVIDPTRGQLLNMYTEAPSLDERIEQGSTIGYIILSLGMLGILYALYLAIKLLNVHLSIKKKKGNSFAIDLEDTYKKVQNQTIDHVELALQERLGVFKQKVHTGLPFLKLLAAVAPLLGLLGTVTGMIATFSAITLFGTGDPKLMAGGISQALVTTVEGLVVAIPLLFAYTLLLSRAKETTENLDNLSLKLLSQHQVK